MLAGIALALKADMRRHGFSALLLVMGTAVLFAIWGYAQQFTQASIRRRVMISEGGKRALHRANEALKSILRFIFMHVNESEDGKKQVSLREQLRSLRPGEVAELSFDYQLDADIKQQHRMPSRVASVEVRAYLTGLNPGSPGKPPLTPEEYRAFIKKWRNVPGRSVEREQEREKLYGDWSPATAEGNLEVMVTGSTDVSGVRIYRELSVRKRFILSMSPYPVLFAEESGLGLGSIVQISPIDLSRTIRGFRKSLTELRKLDASRGDPGIPPGQGYAKGQGPQRLPESIPKKFNEFQAKEKAKKARNAPQDSKGQAR